MLLRKLRGRLGADVSLVPQHVGVLAEHLVADLQVGRVGRRQGEVEDHAAQRDQQVQLVTEDRLLLGRDFAEGGLVGRPVPCRAGHQMELHGRDRQAVEGALPVLG